MKKNNLNTRLLNIIALKVTLLLLLTSCGYSAQTDPIRSLQTDPSF